MARKVKKRKKQSAKAPPRTGQAGSSEFPKNSLEEALQIANALEEKNSGNPIPPTDVAIALEKSPGASGFRILLSSSIKYGLTSGSYNQPRISLEPLGRDIVEPNSPEQKSRALVQAALQPRLFQSVYEAYKNKKLPDMQFFRNALVRDFGVASKHADEFARIFLANSEYVGLVKQATTGKWLSAEADAALAAMERKVEGETGGVTGEEQAVFAPPLPGVTRDETPSSKQAIFVGHGKNKIPLQQLERFLTEYKLPYKVAIDEPSKGRPISQKVSDIMKNCGAAIIIFTADEEFRDKQGNPVYRPSENAVFELGAAGALYGSRLIIFREKDVYFPTNFRDIGHIEFEKDNLSAKLGELFRELIGFGLIKVTVGA